MRSTSRAAAVLSCAVLLVGTLLVWKFHVVESARRPPSIAAGDLFAYFLPAFRYEADALRACRVPLWNPYQGAGVPFLAALQPGALYPGRLLLLLGLVPEVMGWSALLHLILLVLATYAFCRGLGTTPACACVGAAAFGGTFGLPAIYNVAALEPGAWLPLGALAIVHVVRSPNPAWIFGLGAAAAMPVLAGGYQYAVYVAYGYATVALALLLEGPCPTAGPSRVAVVARLLLAAVLALAAAAPQLLPTLAWSTEAVRRATALSDAQIQPFASAAVRSRLIDLTLVRSMPMQLGFLSVPLVLAALAGTVLGRRVGLVLGLAAFCIFGLMLSPGTPWFALYKVLPGFAMFRLPTRLFILVSFFVSVTAALGLDAGTRRLRRITPGAEHLVGAAAFAVVVATVVWPHRNQEHLPWTAAPSVVAAERTWPTVARVTADGRAYLPADRPSLGVGGFVREGMARHVRVLQDYEPLTARRLGRFLAAVAGVAAPDDRAILPFTGALFAAPAIARPGLLDLVGVRTVLASAGAMTDTPAGWATVETDDDLRLYANAHALPRAYTVDRVRFAATEDATLDALIASDFDPRREAILVGAPVPFDPAPDASDAARPATIVRDEPEVVAMDVGVARPGVLVLADAWAPGWSATVDGEPRRLWQANYLVRGVLVRPGDRRVEIRYAAPGFVPGLAIATGVWTAVAVGVAIHSRRRRMGTVARAA